MLVLDCESFVTTLTSVATAAGVPEPELLDGLRRFDPDPVDRSEDFYEAVPSAALASIGVDLEAVSFDVACAFHGTRTLDPHRFLRDGILPLGAMLDRLWDDLYSVAGDHVTRAGWRAVRAELEAGAPRDGLAGQGAYQYRLKTGAPFLHGPYANLVRDHALTPIEGQHDYLKIPEIVEDIARFTGAGLQDRFERAARSCIVKFRWHDVTRHETASAVSYLLSKARHGSHGDDSVHGLDAAGVAVPATDVIAVDEIDLSRRGDPDKATTVRLRR